MKIVSKFGLPVVIAIVASAGVCAAAQIPAYWTKSMTNDPATNYYIAQAMKPLPTGDAETLRIVKLAKVAGGECSGASTNKKVLDAYMAKSGYSKIKGKAYDDAAFLVDDSFKYFDYRALAHLCAGTDYLFGPEGHLAPGLIKVGKGKPKAAYDPKNPYVRLKPLATNHVDLCGHGRSQCSAK